MCTRFIQCHVSPELTRTLFSYVGRAKAMVESVGAPLCACRPARVKKVYYTIDILDDALSHEYTFTGRSFNGPRAESLPAPPRTPQTHKRPRRLSRQSCAAGASTVTASVKRADALRCVLSRDCIAGRAPCSSMLLAAASEALAHVNVV